MKKTNYTPAGRAMSDLVLEIFRASARLLTAGDRLVAELGLTSARWQLLGTIVYAERAQPVSWIARDMGANRQNVQRIVNDLVKDGLLEFQPNPHHRRAQLVVLTEAGREAFDLAMKLQTPWINELAEGVDIDAIQTTHQVLNHLRNRLEEHHDDRTGQPQHNPACQKLRQQKTGSACKRWFTDVRFWPKPVSYPNALRLSTMPGAVAVQLIIGSLVQVQIMGTR
jgi:DNA-binding MarR family transcriptional regulator